MRRVLLVLLCLAIVGCGSQSKIGTSPTKKYTGKLMLFIGESEPSATNTYYLKTSGETYELENPKPRRLLVAGTTVTVTGQVEGKTLENARVAPVSTATKRTTATGTKKIAWIVWRNTGKTAPWTKTEVESATLTNAVSVKKFYEQMSFEKLKVEGHVYGIYATSGTEACEPGLAQQQTKAAAALALAKADGYVASNYTNTQFLDPATCRSEGLFNASESWIHSKDIASSLWAEGVANELGVKTMAHELGHNFGLDHASDIRCYFENVGLPYTNTETHCHFLEYGNTNDMMGTAGLVSEIMAPEKRTLGWWEASQVKDVTANGTFTVLPNETNAAGIHLLRIKRPNKTGNKEYYYVEFHQPTKPFADYTVVEASAPSLCEPYYGGAQVQLAGEEGGLTFLLYMDPTADLPETQVTKWEFKALTLKPGQTYTNSVDGIKLKTESVSAAGVVVSVSLSGAVSVPKIKRALGVSASQVALDWTPIEGATSYEVFRNGAKVGTTTEPHFLDAGRATSKAYKYCVKAVGGAPPCSPNVTGTTTGTSSKGNLVGWVAQKNVGVEGVRLIAHSGGTKGRATTGTNGFYNIRELPPAIEYGVAVVLPDESAFASPILEVLENRATEYSVELP